MRVGTSELPRYDSKQKKTKHGGTRLKKIPKNLQNSWTNFAEQMFFLIF